MCPPRPPPTIPLKNWMNGVIWILMWQEAVRTSNESNKNQIPNLSRTVRPVTKWSEETLERTKFYRDTLNQEKHDDVTDSTSTGRLVRGHKSTERCRLTPKHVERDQTTTETLVTVDQKEEHNIDFRVPGMSHSVVKEAEHLRVQELVKRIETHPHRAALHADLQQNDIYGPFSKDSKEMIRELGNVEFIRVVRGYTKKYNVLTVFSVGMVRTRVQRVG